MQFRGPTPAVGEPNLGLSANFQKSIPVRPPAQPEATEDLFLRATVMEIDTAERKKLSDLMRWDQHRQDLDPREEAVLRKGEDGVHLGEATVRGRELGEARYEGRSADDSVVERAVWHQGQLASVLEERILPTGTVQRLTIQVNPDGMLSYQQTSGPCGDLIAPGPVGNFRGEVSNGRILLHWRASGNHGEDGVASSYEIRTATQPIVEGPPAPGEVSFDQAAPLEAPRPGVSGSEQSLTIRVPMEMAPKPYFFAIRAAGHGLTSPLSTTCVDMPAAQVVFQGNRESEWGGRWLRTAEGLSPRKGAKTRLTSPLINLQGCHKVRLRLRYRPASDVSRPASLEVEPLEPASKVLLHSEPGWRTQEFDLLGYDGRSIRFHLEADSNPRLDRPDFTLESATILAYRSEETSPSTAP